MENKDLFYFISKCLTLSTDAKNRNTVKEILKSNSIQWNEFVKISSAHYILPALYMNFKIVGFINYLPDDLVNYMKKITEINENRNNEILKQVNEINKILRRENIVPIFIKGVGNLLSNLYYDNSERMIGDIDFIVSRKDYSKSIKIMVKNGYEKFYKLDYDVPIYRHYARLVKKNNIAAVEIHKELVIEKYSDEFNHSFISNRTINVKGFQILDHSDMLILSIISDQINDERYFYKTLCLKNAYDVFLLSKKINMEGATKHLEKLTKVVKSFVYVSYIIFNKIPELKFIKNSKTIRDYMIFEKNLINGRNTKIRFRIIKSYLNLISYYNLIINCIKYSEYRTWLLNRIADKDWQRKKLYQLGIKKRRT